MVQYLIIFATVFLAELGDKTQLATLLFATEKNLSPWMVFTAASLALVCSTGLAVLAGTFAERFLTDIPVKLIAGLGFIAIGVWTVYDHFRVG